MDAGERADAPGTGARWPVLLLGLLLTAGAGAGLAPDAPGSGQQTPEAPPQDGPPPTAPADDGRQPGHGAPPPLREEPSPPASAPTAGTEPASPAGPVVTATADGTPVFVDRAAASGLDFVHFNGRSGRLHFGEILGSGGAFLDYDGDGDLDVFLVQGDRLAADEAYEDATPPPHEDDRPPRDRLFRNLLAETGELRFRDVTEEAGLGPPAAESTTSATGAAGLRYGMGAAVGDVDGDGDPDLYVTGLTGNRLWWNRGDGTFSDVTAVSRSDDPRWSTAATFLDHDADGDLDLFVANYVSWTAAHPERCTARAGHRDYCGPLSYPPVADRLLENLGPGEDGVPRFANVSSTTGIRFAFGAALGAVGVDLLGDPRPEIYVANDASANQLWSAAGDGTWSDRALEAGLALDGDGRPEGSMGIDAGDFDEDGDLDLFLTHVHRETNTLYRNDGAGHFTDATRAAGLARPSLGRTGFGTGFLDYDNDGWLDLLVVNGSVTLLPEQQAAGDAFPLHQPDQLFRNLGRRPDRARAGLSAEEGEAEDAPPGHGDPRTGAAEDPGTAATAPGRGAPAIATAANTASADPAPADVGAAAADATAGDRGIVRFADVSASAGAALTVSRVSRGAVFGDVDDDGDTDVLVTDSGGPPRLLINQVGQRRPWLGLRLLRDGTDDPGARVTVELPSGRRLLRRVRIDGSYLSAHDPRILVGLGDETEVRAAVVRWSDGSEERFPLAGQPVRRYLELHRGEGRDKVPPCCPSESSASPTSASRPSSTP